MNIEQNDELQLFMLTEPRSYVIVTVLGNAVMNGGDIMEKEYEAREKLIACAKKSFWKRALPRHPCGRSALRQA